MGDAGEIRRKRARKQKTERQDAQHILCLLLKNDFPADLGAELGESGSATTAGHRHRMVQPRTRIMNQLQAVALNEGLLCRKKLWRNVDANASKH